MGFDRWVEQNIGLNYEMFTCSMLLRQGQAEKLLEATPKQRFDIVAEVADLKSYQLLHEKADARRLKRKSQLDADSGGVGARRPLVEPAAIEEAEARLSKAEGARAEASADRDRLATIEGQAQLWRELSAGRERARGEAERARQIIEASATIEADWNRLRELDGVLPALLEESSRRAGVAEREAAVSDRQAKREILIKRLDDLSALAEQSRRRLAEVVEEITGDETRRTEIVARQGELAVPIARAKGATVQRLAVASLEVSLAAYPADLEDETARLADEVARRTEWKAALPTLENLDAARAGLAGARSRVEAGGEDVAIAVAKVRHAGNVLEAARGEESRARLAKEEIDRRSTEVRTIFRSAQGRLADFERLEGSTACDRCGQPLTPEHFAAEARRLHEERDKTQRVTEDAERLLLDAEDRARSAEATVVEADRIARKADAALADARRDFAQSEADTSRHEAACAKAFGDLDDSFRSAIAMGLVADWAATTYPTPVDLAEGHRLRDGLPEADRLAREARLRLEAMKGERWRLEEARQGLDSIGLRPGDEQAEGEHSRLTDEVASLDRCLKTHRLDQASAESAIDELSKKIDHVRGEIAVIDAQQATNQALIDASREASARSRVSVPGPWLAAFDSASRDELDAWEAERRSLRDRGIEQLAEEVPKAHWTLNAAETQVAELDARLDDVPEEARRDLGEIAESKERATACLKAAEEDARALQRDLDALRRHRDERADLEAQALEADRSLAVSSKLAELLGRASLQRDLIRDAERGILDCANPILRDISGDDLELRLSGEDSGDDHALPLEVIDRTHGPGRTLGVAFLSGSQRFRVAVSLALGIGQYARGLDRPIQSVVIDEGFGCLDRQGRDEMIAQLTALKGRLARIVLVSHQEEFAEAFKDGYRFEVRDGSTVVQEFHR